MDSTEVTMARRGLLKPSTRAWIEEAKKTPDHSSFDTLHGYVYTRWPYFYIGTAKREHPITRFLDPVITWLAGVFWSDEPDHPTDRPTFADSYHGKVVPLDAATQLVTVKRDIRLTDLEQVIHYRQARDIVLKNPDHIVALECPCRAYAPNPCEPLDVCLIVGEPFAGFVAEHHPRRSRWITPQEAIEILRAEDERGHAHHAFFKDAMFGRFYAICNCCDCCCGAMLAHQNGVPMLASSGYVCQVNAGLCVGCATCTESCPFGALSMQDGVAAIDAGACMGCGVCVCQCTQEALSLARDPAKGEPLEIHRLIEEVAL
jgi:Pyruvate/2-oxoacid:ferredoxin oxidoreductase delta subunit